MQTTFVKCSL